MVKPNSPPLDRVFAALADPSRRAMVERLEGGDCTVGELAAMFDFSLPAVSKHLRVLERAGLLNQTRQGRARLCRLNRESLLDVSWWLTIRQNMAGSGLLRVPHPRAGVPDHSHGRHAAVAPQSIAGPPDAERPPVQTGVQLPEFD